MKQLSLFGAAPQPVAAPVAAPAAIPVAPVKIRVHRRCHSCPGLFIDWHTPIHSVAYMQAAGWTLLAPNEWATPDRLGCSRYCETRKSGQKLPEFCPIP